MLLGRSEERQWHGRLSRRLEDNIRESIME
jgi:hypothetical protein